MRETTTVTNATAQHNESGHASAAMTLDVYSDLFDDDLSTVGMRLNAAAISTDVVKRVPKKRNRPHEEAENAANKGL